MTTNYEPDGVSASRPFSLSSWLLIIAGVLALGLPRVVVHQSDSPSLLGRYSSGYFVFMMAYGVAIAIVLLIVAVSWRRRATFFQRIEHLLSKYPRLVLTGVILINFMWLFMSQTLLGPYVFFDFVYVNISLSIILATVACLQVAFQSADNNKTIQPILRLIKTYEFWIVIGFCLVVVLAIFYAAFPYGLGTTPDTVSYFQAGDDFRDSGRIRLTYRLWPPFYPMLIGLVSLSGLNPAHSAIMVNAASVVVFGVLFWIWSRGALHSVWLRLCLIVSVLTLLPVQWIWRQGLSDMVFLTIDLAFLIGMTRYLKLNQLGWLIVALVAAMAGSMTRYIGLIFLPIGVILICFNVSMTWWRRLLTSVVWAGIGAIPTVLWFLRNYSFGGNTIGSRGEPRQSPLETAYWIIDNVSQWFIPGQIFWLTRIVVLFILIGCVLVILGRYASNHRDWPTLVTIGVPFLTAGSMIVGLWYSASTTFVDTGLRHPAISLPALMMLIYLAADIIIRQAKKQHPSVSRQVQLALVTSIGLWVLMYPIVATRTSVTKQHLVGTNWYYHQRWHDNTLVEEAESMVESGNAYGSNNYKVIYMHTWQEALSVEDIPTVIQTEQQELYLFWFNENDDAYADFDDWQAYTLDVIQQTPDGTIYKVSLP